MHESFDHSGLGYGHAAKIWGRGPSRETRYRQTAMISEASFRLTASPPLRHRLDSFFSGRVSFGWPGVGVRIRQPPDILKSEPKGRSAASASIRFSGMAKIGFWVRMRSSEP